MDARLRSWSQRFILQSAWMIGCQITPWFSGLYLLSQSGRGIAITGCVLLHLAAAGAGLAHTSVRSSLLQMTPGRSLAFRLLPLALLLPFPASLVFLILWLPASEDTKEDKGLVQTLYRTRAARRHPLAATRRLRQEEIRGETEDRRRRAEAGKIFLLFFESAALSRLAAVNGLSPFFRWTLPALLLLGLLVLPAILGAVLLLAGAVERIVGGRLRFSPLTNHPSAVSLTVVPAALVLGALCGAFDGSKRADLLGLLLLKLAILSAYATLLATLWSFLLTLLSGRPERPYTWRIITLVLFLVLAAISHLLAQPPIFQWLVTLTALASPFWGIAIAARWLAPLRLKDLKDQRLPRHLRKRLGWVALTAILPLGGLALPWWGEVRRRYGSEIDRWAAQLREPVP